jgi:tRNA modification GTPase
MSIPVLDDTIAAIATAPGQAGLAVVRVSGARALEYADAVFRGRVVLADAGANTLHHGWAVAPVEDGGTSSAGGGRVDEVVAAVFRAPHSYTREDVVEFSCHGGRMPAARVLEELRRAGARLAGPGEFTLRAFLNGRIDLAQAEAVADLIAAESEAARTAAVDQLGGALSRALDGLDERLADLRAEIEARVDFAEDVGGVEIPPGAVDALGSVGDGLDALLERSRVGARLRAGVRVPLVGRPNAGKSSLFNLLVGEERALVTPVAGTTRDRVSEAIEVGGVRVQLSDTAGLRAEPADAIESMGVGRTRDVLAECRVAVWVIDGAEPLGTDDLAVASALTGRDVVVALNQRDRGVRVTREEVERLLPGARHVVVETVATRGDGGDRVLTALAGLLGVEARHGGLGVAASHPRHIEALEEARDSVRAAAVEARDGAAGEVVAARVRDAQAALGRVTGRAVDDGLLERIFSRFCIGK